MFFGEKISAKGVEIDNSKVKAITDMPRPQNKEALQRALGMYNYVAKFIPNMSATTEAIRSLLKKNVQWQWNYEQQQEWKYLKSILRSDYSSELRETKI